MRRLKLIRVRAGSSRTTVINSAISVAKLVEIVSDAVNFSPTKGAAKIVLLALEALKEVDDNDETRNRLMKRISGVVDLLRVIQRRCEVSNDLLPDDLAAKMTGVESVLNSLHEALTTDTFLLHSFWRRTLARDKIKGELDMHLDSLNEALDGFKTWLLLDTRVAIHSLTVVSQAPPSNSLVSNQESCIAEDETWSALCSEYEVVRLCDVELESEVEATVGCLPSFYHAEVKGKKRLVKSFNGNDKTQKEEWLREIHYWHQFRHPNLLQMQGFTTYMNNPHLYIVFKNAQARCLATYVLDALNTSDTHSIAIMLVKMTNDATSALKYAARQLHMNDATAVLVADEVSLALDSGDRLILSLCPPSSSPSPGHAMILSLTLSIQTLLWPPVTESWKGTWVLRAIEYKHKSWCWDLSDQHDESGKFYPRPTSHPMFAAPVVYSTEVKPGDYGVLIPGPKEEFSIQAYGNPIDESPGLVSFGEYSALWNNMLREYFEREADSPSTWCLDFNKTASKGFSDVIVRWEEKIQELRDVPQVMQYLINSIPNRPRPLVTSLEEIVVVTEVHHFKDYRFSLQNLESNGQGSDALDPQRSSEISCALPVVYATQPDPQAEGLVFSQRPAHSRSQAGPTSPGCTGWDDRVQYKGKDRENKRIRYVRLRMRKEDIIESES